MSDDIMYDSKEDCYMVSEERLEEFEKAVTELESLKSRLPVNADGDYPNIGDKQWKWFRWPEPGPEELEIRFISDWGKGWRFEFTNGMIEFASTCHSTAESCRAAHEKGE